MSDHPLRIEVTGVQDYCIFCFQHKSNAIPYCKDNPGKGCTYGGPHEFWDEVKPAQPQAPKRDPKLCEKCGLHPKNPQSATNGCQHQYGGQ